MMRFKCFLVVLMVLSVVLLVACGGEDASPAPAGDEPVASGEELLQSRCVDCHGIDRVTSEQKTLEEWENTVTRMVEKGTKLSAEEQEVLVAYLAETYGP